VRVQAVETRKSPTLEEVVGTVRARLRATMEAKTAGRIIELPVVLGQQVQAGELLVRLEAPEIKARLEQAEAGLEQAEREFKRVSALIKDHAATQADFDNANSRYLMAKGAVAEARAVVSYLEVRAPFAGVVTRKWADVGDLAAPGKPLVDLQDPTRLQLEADVPEAIASKVQAGATLSVRLGEGTAEIAGTVAELAPQADPVSRTLRVKLDLPAGPGLISGRFARLLVPVGETASLRVPESAVVQRGQMELVFVAANQRAQLHLVKTGRRVGHELEILSGLADKDEVVVENASRLVDGQPLEVR
jgi:RND family efflux transporter MFP subunit